LIKGKKFIIIIKYIIMISQKLNQKFIGTVGAKV
jgi:hypothetical protein